MTHRALAPLLLLAVLAGCGGDPGGRPAFHIDTPPDTGVGAPVTNDAYVAHRDDHPGVLTVDPNHAHVTGLPYPSLCTRLPGADPQLPVRACTPGSVRSDINAAVLCARGFTTDLIRPEPNETAPVKTAALRAYGIPPAKRASTELDHLVPLSLGGSDDVTNLWPQPSDIPNAQPAFRNTKDDVESWLHDAVCAHQVSLAAAQWAIGINWTTAIETLGLPVPKRK